jgi:hypothetical protein
MDNRVPVTVKLAPAAVIAIVLLLLLLGAMLGALLCPRRSITCVCGRAGARR